MGTALNDRFNVRVDRMVIDGWAASITLDYQDSPQVIAQRRGRWASQTIGPVSRNLPQGVS